MEIERHLNTLRDRSIPTHKFRQAAHWIGDSLMKQTRKIILEHNISEKNIVLAVILRASLALLPSALKEFPNAPVGVLGFKRDEKTLRPRFYYENLPALSKKITVILIDPMLATGGSGEAAIRRFKKRGASEKNIFFVGVVAAPQGLGRLAKLIPKENIVLAAIDRGLTKKGMITPGIGDFGDRYFGHNGKAII